MMRMMLIGGTLLLAGCGGGGGADTNRDGKVSADEMKAEMAKGGDIRLSPGQWEYQIAFTKFDMGGDVPDGVAGMIREQMGKGMTIKHCLTPEEAAKNDASAFTGEGMKGCTVSKFDRSGGTIDMAMQCTEGGATRAMTMKGSFAPARYDMKIDQKISGGPAPMTMSGTMTGKRTGDCAG
jgi:hypothetical protein